MGRSRGKSKGRRESGHFAAIPFSVLQSPAFAYLSPKAVKLLMDMVAQIRIGKDGGPKNNGDLSIAWALMTERGWKSKQTLYNARDELEQTGFIEQTRQGGKRRCSLYAISWWAIDECNGKLDIGATCVPTNRWKTAGRKLEPLWPENRTQVA